MLKIEKLLKEDVLSSLSSNLIKIVKGPLLAFLIILYLTPDEQGYWYTFQSLIVFAIIGDLGISRLIVVIFPDYHVKIRTSTNHSELKTNLIDYSSIFFTYLITYAFLIIATSILLIFTVEYFYSDWPNNYLKSWFYCAIFSSANILSTFSSAVLYSSDLVSKKNYFEQIFAIIFTITASILLLYNFKIDALAISILFGFLISHLFLVCSYHKPIRKLYRLFNYKKGIKILLHSKNLQFKFFTSAIISLYISSSLVPFAMKYFDPNLAGRLGLSLFLINSIITFSLIFNYIEYPKIIKLINKKKYYNVRKKCLELFLTINAFYIIISFMFLTLIYFSPESFDPYFDRLLPYRDLLVLFITQGILMNIGFIAGIVRGFKVEPYWILGVLQLFTTSTLFYFTIKSSTIRTYLTLDLILHLLILLPMSIYLGKNQLRKIVA